jgi:AraC family transcriptional regulator
MRAPASMSMALPLARIEADGIHAMPDRVRAGATFERSWRSIRVMRLPLESGEVPEGALVNHAIFLNLGDDAGIELRLEGGPWQPHTHARHGWSLLPAGVPHAVRGGLRDALLLELDADFVAGVLRGSRGGAPTLRPLVVSTDAFTTHVALAMAEQARCGAALDDLGIAGLVSALVAHLAELSRAGAPAPALPAPAGLPSVKLRRVLGYVAAHLDAPLTLRTLADVAEADLFRFVRSFKMSTGVSPHRYVMEARIELAKRLLRDRRLSITDVALRTGFATPSHFSVTFRRMTQMTPRAYRDSVPPSP